MSSVELSYGFRTMGMADLDDVLENEELSYSHPWSRGIFVDCIKSDYICRTFTLHERIIGHGILSVAIEESHLLNVCIKPACQGKGYGRILVERMLDCARSRNVDSIFLEVRMSNPVAYKLYESLGFNDVGLRKGYYPAVNGREDAIVMAKELIYE